MDAENLDIKILCAKTKDLPLTKISTKWKPHTALVYFIQKSVLLKNRVLFHCDHIATSPSKWEVFANVRRLSPSMAQCPSQLSRSHLCPPVWVSVPLRCSGLRDPLAEAQRLLLSLGKIMSLPGLWFSHAFCSPPWTFWVFRGLPLHVHLGIAALNKSHISFEAMTLWLELCWLEPCVSCRGSSWVPQTGPESDRSLWPPFLVTEPLPPWPWFLPQFTLPTLTSHLLAGWASLLQRATFWVQMPTLSFINLWR